MAFQEKNPFAYYSPLADIYLKNYKNKVICCNILEYIDTFPDNFFFVSAFSPPYFQCRDYGVKPVIMGGNPNCAHKWFDYMRKGMSGGLSKKVKVKGIDNFQAVDNIIQSICSLCGAHRANFGREPYVLDHIFEIDPGKPVLVKGYNTTLCDFVEALLKKTRPDGSVWINLGDTYSTTTNVSTIRPVGIGKSEFPLKSLCLIPSWFSTEMLRRGYIVRNEIIWRKGNAFTQPASDRLTVNFEKWFFIAKNNQPLYWVNQKTLQMVTKKPKGTNGEIGKDWEWRACERCMDIVQENSQAIKKFLRNCAAEWWFAEDEDIFLSAMRSLSHESFVNSDFVSVCENCDGGKMKQSAWEPYDYYFEQQFESLKHVNAKKIKFGGIKLANNQPMTTNATYSGKSYNASDHLHGKNMRAVWDINVKPSKYDHIAAFSEDIVSIPINAGAPPYFCAVCGLPRVRVYEYGKFDPVAIYSGNEIEKYKKLMAELPQLTKEEIMLLMRKTRRVKGLSKCQCETPKYIPGFVFDPYLGTGTTAQAALNKGLGFIGTEIKKEYVEIINSRTANLRKSTKIDDFWNVIK